MFKPVVLTWDGRSYTIQANQIMRALAVIEDHVTMLELQRAFKSGGAPLAKISNAFAAVIQFAGGSVTADDVYSGMFGGGTDAAAAQQAVTMLLMMMIPPNAGTMSDEAADVAIKKSGGAVLQSRSLSKRQSHGGSRRPNSGK
jgi:hypothetical protein